MENDIKKVLITEKQLQERAAELAKTIVGDYNGEEFVTISALKGAFIFMADIVRHFDVPTQMDFIIASSYGNSTVSSGNLNIKRDVEIDLKGKNILLLEDIVDTGRTLACIKENFLSRGAKSVKICTMLDKPDRREVEVYIDYTGFRIENEFVVGYGLDYAEKYRNLPYVGVLKEEVYSK